MYIDGGITTVGRFCSNSIVLMKNASRNWLMACNLISISAWERKQRQITRTNTRIRLFEFLNWFWQFSAAKLAIERTVVLLN